MKKTILIVDDNNTNLHTAREALSDEYRVVTLDSANKMFIFLEKVEPDLILLDIEMPEIDGIKALKMLKSDDLHKDIPVMFLTVMRNPAIEAQAFNMGVVDFITKPFSKLVLLNRIKNHLNIGELIRKDVIQRQNEQFERQATFFRRLNNGTISVLANVIESRDEAKIGHVERISNYAEILANAMFTHENYSDMRNRISNVGSFVSAARLHDIGKVVVPESVLNKPGELTPEEFEQIKHHTIAGEKIIDQLINATGNVNFLHNAKIVALSHHERWDGTGYPNQLVGHKIPVQGRIIALVDTYDAITSERPYRSAVTHERAVEIIMESKGTQFDPTIAEIFYEIHHQFRTINESYV
ncbi:MAG: response regulator [Defluviitaleaceae bacterium]|nr:response regulator [Defluviitaleaceae bacterium]